MPAASYLPSDRLSPSQAAEIASRARKLMRQGRLTAHSYVVLDALLWSARPPGAARAVASYDRLQKLAHVARATVAKGIKAMQALGLAQKVKRRVLVAWNNGGRACRQLANEYRLISVDRCEFTTQTESKQIQFIKLDEPNHTAQTAAQKALAARRRALEERLLTR